MKSKLTSYPADLHIHTILSPCAGREMRPENIWRQAEKMGIKILGITDHNSTANLPAFLHSAPPGLWNSRNGSADERGDPFDLLVSGIRAGDGVGEDRPSAPAAR
ncbi:MAG: PHP domain-containing protein [Firmicutes bacterium]|nr:PHP domain-containing protein [Bacillota bacterium]